MTRLLLAGADEATAHQLHGHPERPTRVTAALHGVHDLDLGGDLVIAGPREATVDELARVHSRTYLSELEALCRSGGGQLDPDTYATPESWAIAKRAAGATLAAVDGLRRREAAVAFVAARPPGHHAGAASAMGFCLLNNVAVAAATLADAGERVAVLDWDVHHGNGTQDVFWDDPRVLYMSMHQAPFYPGTGALEEVGGPSASGLTVNVPLPAGATGDVVQRALEEVAVPVAERFAPDWLLISAGFDAHRADPLGELQLSSGDFAALARVAAQMAPPGRLLVLLEGGYDTDAIRSSVAASLAAVLGAGRDDERRTSGGPGADAVERARRIHVS